MKRRVLVAATLMLAIWLPLESTTAVEGDVVMKRSVENSMLPPAVFSHWFHRIRYKCYACHPTLFKMKRGAEMTMDDITEKGKYCGACHNGTIAWSVSFENCKKCHIEK